MKELKSKIEQDLGNTIKQELIDSIPALYQGEMEDDRVKVWDVGHMDEIDQYVMYHKSSQLYIDIDHNEMTDEITIKYIDTQTSGSDYVEDEFELES